MLPACEAVRGIARPSAITTETRNGKYVVANVRNNMALCVVPVLHSLYFLFENSSIISLSYSPC